jgi:hypothetical protein
LLSVEIMRMLKLSLLLLALPLAAQEALTKKPTEIFPLRVGNRWVLRNQATGATTTFEIEARANFGCEKHLYPLHITKSDDATYWSPGRPEEFRYYLRVLRDGTIASPGAWSWNYVDKKPASTINTRTERPGTPPTNLILKPRARDGEVVRTHSTYLFGPGIHDAGCLKPGPPRIQRWPRSTWTTKFTIESVDTPAYTGRALCARYSEGTDEVENNAEQWCFALDKKIGLVQLTNIHNHYEHVTFENPPMVLKLEQYTLK